MTKARGGTFLVKGRRFRYTAGLSMFRHPPGVACGASPLPPSFSKVNTMSSHTTPTFQSLGLSAHVLKALSDVGYETPSPIQAASIPHLLAGRDLLGQPPTGTGQTAAPFAADHGVRYKTTDKPDKLRFFLKCGQQLFQSL